MLHKVDSLSEIGRFATLRHKAPQFARLTLLFAKNAYGKSTICAVLSAAAERDPLGIYSRRRLDAAAEPRVSIEWDTSVAAFDRGSWNRDISPIAIFDQDYVERNVHVAGHVTRTNKRELLPVVVGETGVQLAKDVEGIDAEIRQINMELGSLDRMVKSAHPLIVDPRAYASAAIPDEIDEQIETAGRNLELARRATAIAKQRMPSQFEIPSEDDLHGILQSTIEDAASDTIAAVEEHLAKHSMAPRGQQWLKFGFDHTDDTSCPYCGQSTSGVALVETFKTYFSATFSAHVQRIEQIASRFAAVAETLDHRLADNATDIDAWAKVCKLPPIESLSGHAQDLRLGLAEVKSQLQKKQADPIRAVDTIAARPVIDALYNAARSYNDLIERCSIAAAQAQVEARNADEGRAVRVLATRQALKAKAHEPMKSVTDKLIALSARKGKLETDKAEKQAALKQHVSTSVTTRQAQINALLRAFGANFEIGQTKASFVGRDPSAEYAVLIGRHAVHAGSVVEGKPSFKTVLSAGDKYTLALAFFLTHLRARPDVKECVVVLDDPFSSQDMHRQFETASQIRRLVGETRQVVVLSHDPRFLHLIYKDADPAVVGEYQICLDSDHGGSVRSWSSEEELKSAYVRQSERIRNYASTGQFLKDSSAEGLIRDLRPFLEQYIRHRFPGRFAMLKMLPDMIGEVEAGGSDDPLFASVAELRSLNEYTRGDMHGGASVPDADQLRAQCRKVVDLVGRY